MNNKLSGIISVVIMLAMTVASITVAESSIEERRAYLKSETNVSDDPRRIPLPAGLLEPKGSIVLTGGRVFDGTGSAARPGTVVISGKKVVAILPPESRDWKRL